MEDVGQVEYLRLCPQLRQLTLTGNPISRAGTVGGVSRSPIAGQLSLSFASLLTPVILLQGVDAYREDIFARVPQ